MTTNSREPLKMFYCYAHEDKILRDQLDAHLSIMKRQKMVEIWYDREIIAGREWEYEIDKHLASAHIILLLVSAWFLASDYCYGIEMQKALQRHQAGMARVVPILLRPVDWEDAPFSYLQILPTGAIPVTRWTDYNDAFEDIAKELRRVAKELYVSLQSLPQQPSDNIQLPKGLKEATLRKAYTAVKNGNIKEVEAVRTLATQFEDIANNPELNKSFTFDARKAALSLYAEADRLQEEEEANSRLLFSDETKVNWPKRSTDNENYMHGG